ncbi:MAG: hypothetical protein EBW42_14975 [Rhodobacterales bacterium]|nr:hypothetical protein [Rhodobacterales bacterium]
MSNTTNTMILENLFDEVLAQDAKGLLENEVNDIAREQGLHVDDDRDEILEIITNRIFEVKYD